MFVNSQGSENASVNGFRKIRKGNLCTFQKCYFQLTEVGNDIIRFLMHKKAEADTERCQWRIHNPVKNI